MPKTKKRKLPDKASVPSTIGDGEKGCQNCEYCHRDITNQLRIRCAECEEFHLCLDCFASGVEISSHQRTHRYSFIEVLNFSVLDNEWTAHEELMLLQALDLYGLDNWRDVARHVGSKATSKCEEHYYQYFIDFPGTGPCPDVSRCTERKALNALPASTMAEIMKSAEARQMKPQNQLTEEKAGHAGCPPGSEIVGYIPPRPGDFDLEYDNDAEMVLADMFIELKDGPTWENRLKLTLLERLAFRLDERYRRNKHVLQHQLLDLEEQQPSGQRRNPEEEQLHQQFRAVSRVMVPEKYEELLLNHEQEQLVRKRMRELEVLKNGDGC